MAETVKRFHADQKAQKELEEMREKMDRMEKLLSGMVGTPGFEKVIEEVVKKEKE